MSRGAPKSRSPASRRRSASEEKAFQKRLAAEKKLEKELAKERERAAKKRADAAAKQEAKDSKEAASIAGRTVAKLAVLAPRLSRAVGDPRCAKIPRTTVDDIKAAKEAIDDMHTSALEVAARDF